MPITYSVVTNIDKEHLDYYKNFKKLKNSFLAFIEKTPSFGKTIICLDNINIKKLINNFKTTNFLTYGFDKKSNYQILNLKKKQTYSIFDLKIKLTGSRILKIKNIRLNLLGNHNIRNSTAAIAIALNLGVKTEIIKKALKKFSGIQRRFTKVLSMDKRDFYDDYAHHPTEIKAVLEGARHVYKNRKIISVFQPHRYSRVKLLEKDFASSFKLSDQVVLCPVYSAGEKDLYKYNEEKFSKLISKNSKTQIINIKDQHDLKNFFKKNLFSDELVICMGAGSISTWIRKIAKEL